MIKKAFNTWKKRIPRYKKQENDELCDSSDNTCTTEPKLEKSCLPSNDNLDNPGLNSHINNIINERIQNYYQSQRLAPPNALVDESEAPRSPYHSPENGIIDDEREGPPSLSIPVVNNLE